MKDTKHCKKFTHKVSFKKKCEDSPTTQNLAFFETPRGFTPDPEEEPLSARSKRTKMTLKPD